MSFVTKNEKIAPGYQGQNDAVILSGRMFQPLFVNKSLNPRASKGKNKDHLHVYWRANSKPRITSELFVDWFKNCFLKEK